MFFFVVYCVCQCEESMRYYFLIVKKKQILVLTGELRTFLEKSVIQSCFMADVYLQFASGDKFFLTRMLLQI